MAQLWTGPGARVYATACPCPNARLHNVQEAFAWPYTRVHLHGLTWSSSDNRPARPLTSDHEKMLVVSHHNHGRTWPLTLSTVYLVWIRTIGLSRHAPLSRADYSIGPVSKGEFPHVKVTVSFEETIFMAPSYRILLFLQEACSYIPIIQSMSELEDLNHVTTISSVW